MWVLEEIPKNILLAVGEIAALSVVRIGVAIHTATVVLLAFDRVGEYAVGFGYLLEFLFRLWIVRIAVGVVLHCQLSIVFANLLASAGFGHAQYLIIVFHCHACSLLETGECAAPWSMPLQTGLRYYVFRVLSLADIVKLFRENDK